MRVVLSVPGADLEFVPPHADGAPYRYLVAVGALRVAARAGRVAGLGVGESPNLEVQLQNAARETASLIGTPLRCPVMVYEDDGSLFFDGIVSKVALGKTITLTLES